MQTRARARKHAQMGTPANSGVGFRTLARHESQLNQLKTKTVSAEATG